MDFREARELFPALKNRVFLDSARVGTASVRSADAVARFVRDVLAGEAEPLMHEYWEAARSAVARLIGASEEEIALTSSTTEGLNTVAEVLDLEPGDNVVTDNLEFSQVIIPWRQRSKRHKIEIRMVPHRDGRILVEDIETHIDDRTRVIAVSSVQWQTGYRIDLKALGELAKSRNIYLVVDAVQHLGAMRLSVRDAHIDFLACGGHKWLCSPFGTGFLYVRRELVDKLEPLRQGYFNEEEPEGGWQKFFSSPELSPDREYKFVRTAKKFEVGGTTNCAGALSLAASIDLLHEIGPERVERRIVELTDFLIDSLERVGARVVSPKEPEARSGIVTFRAYDDIDLERKLLGRILDAGILLSMRFTSGVGGIRAAVHYFNNEEDLEKLLDVIRVSYRDLT